MTQEDPTPTTLNISFPLQGDEAEWFLRHKKRAFLKGNAEFGRKLVFERLAQLDEEIAEKAEVA